MTQTPPNQDEESSYPTRFWRALEDGRVECTLCPRLCKMREGQRGLCFVRGVEGGEVVLKSFGRSSGFCIDPIEKKPLNHFLPGTPVLSFGTAGCNLTCKFCQNHDISKARAFDRLQQDASPDAIAEAAREHEARSVAYTYNDPVIFHEYAVETAKSCRALGIKNVAVSAGYVSAEPRAEFYAQMDAANIDLKSFNPDFYYRLTSAKLEPVLETLQYIFHETDCWLEITTLIIPGENDSDAEIQALSEWVGVNLGDEVPLHFTAFHPDYRMLQHPRTPPETLLRARRIAMEAGLRHVYVGNVHNALAQSTYCGQCGGKVIGRDWHQISSWQLEQGGFCGHCGAPLSGVFEGEAGDWGRKRQPVRIAR